MRSTLRVAVLPLVVCSGFLCALHVVAQTQTTTGAGQAEFSLALTGDSLITRPLSPYKEPEYQKLIELLRSQDAAFTNLEMSLHDYETYPMVESGGLHLRADPAIAKELVWAGFRLASLANNHILDWGVTGLRLTRKYAQAAGLVVAGVGESLSDARAPAFLETARGRIGLVATASTFTLNAPAGNSSGDIPARPGLSPLRFSTTSVVTTTAMAAIRNLAAEMRLTLPQGDRISFLGRTFQLGDRPALRTMPSQADVERIASAVSNARRLSDITIVSIHAHEGVGGTFNTSEPAQFLVTFAHAMIDAGADVFVGHGPHVLRGIEIYKGKPIFYSLGNFVYENETVQRLPADDFEAFGLSPSQGIADLNETRYDHDRTGSPAQREIWESVVAVPRWRNRTLHEVDLYPISLGFGRPETFRGRPMLAADNLSRKIIGDLQRLSAPLGTKIEYRDGTGIVAIASDQRQ